MRFRAPYAEHIRPRSHHHCFSLFDSLYKYVSYPPPKAALLSSPDSPNDTLLLAQLSQFPAAHIQIYLFTAITRNIFTLDHYHLSLFMQREHEVPHYFTYREAVLPAAQSAAMEVKKGRSWAIVCFLGNRAPYA